MAGDIAKTALKAIKQNLDTIEQVDQSYSDPIPGPAGPPNTVVEQFAHAFRYLDSMFKGWDNMGQYSQHILVSYFWIIQSAVVGLGLARHTEGSEMQYVEKFEEVFGGKQNLSGAVERMKAIAGAYAEGELSGKREEEEKQWAREERKREKEKERSKSRSGSLDLLNKLTGRSS